jgi:GAF domain-containing protein
MENARLINETREALEQQTATSEVLQVINSSPGDLTPVFDAILEKAHSLCDIAQGSLELYDGEWFRAVAVRGLSDEFAEILRQGCPAADNPATQPLIEGRRFAHILDLAETDYTVTRSAAELDAARTLLCVPLRRDNTLLGMIASARREVRPFSDKEIALLENFAAQAVIAMENARLITETREALEQQTATAEVLQVINSSPGDLTPVFEAMLEKATRLCDAPFGALRTFDGEFFNLEAIRGDPEWVEQVRRAGAPGRGGFFEPLARGERVVNIADLRESALYQVSAAMRDRTRLGKIRSYLAVALHKEDILVGCLIVYRQEVRPFGDKEIALLQNFAAQAVIAMENARLLTETREALAQQTATAEVLQVINSSPGDLAPVFDAILDKAQRVCSVDHAALELYDGERMHAVAVHGASDRFAETLRQRYRASDSPAARALLEGQRFAQIPDAAQIDQIAFRTAAEVDGVRTVLFVPLRRDDAFLGMIASARREVRLFSEKEIALLENFAAQAVIAMENARLLTETREALEQQTATAEILQVINRSPGDLAPVFETILEKAHALGGASRGTLFLFDGEIFRAAASQGYPDGPPERMRRGITVSEDPRLAALLAGERLIHVPDLMQLEDPIARAVAERGGVRTNLLLPLRKDDALLGVLSCNRAEVRPFSDKQIALLESFAAQAVIAMDNARLLDEIRQRQAELRVTFDNMGDGVAMFDDELRLAAWNRNFQEMLDLPDALLAERPTYADYVRALAERGEFGSGDIEAELNRRLAETDQELRLERARPDGRIIEVRRNTVPGGGFVLIYGDVTERRRAEEEIRAARDTAERALQELKTTQASLLHAQKMAALGQLTAGIAHEIKNPLNFVNNFAGLSVELLDELKETAGPAIAALAEDERADVDEIVGMLTGNLEKIAEHGRRADGIVKSMLEHSRGGGGERREVDLNGLVEEALNLAYHGARAQDQNFNITLERDFDRALARIELAPQEMTRVFLNLFGNGFYAATKRQRDGARPDFRPALKVATSNLGEAVEIRIRDNGTGIPPEIRDKLFQPFFTTKPSGEGTGLGLSISWDIVTQQHGGTIAVDSRVGEFTEFAIRLPRTRAAPAAEAAA